MNNKQRIIFMGSPSIAREYLQTLIINKFNIVAVYTQPPRPKGRGMEIQNSPVHQEAMQNGIPVHHPTDFNDQKTVNTFIDLQADLVVVMAYGKLLPLNIINTPSYGCINIHISLLPRWRGAAPVEHALLNGDKQTGVSIFRLVSELDAGPILSKVTISIEQDINKENLLEKLTFVGKNLLIKTLPNYFNNKIVLEEQNIEEATYASKISSELTRINFNDKAINIFNKIRAFSPKPGAWFKYNNERFKIIKCQTSTKEGIPSTIVNSEFNIACDEGLIVPKIIQKEGKKPMGIGEFLKGFKFTIGEKVNVQI